MRLLNRHPVMRQNARTVSATRFQPQVILKRLPIMDIPRRSDCQFCNCDDERLLFIPTDQRLDNRDVSSFLKRQRLLCDGWYSTSHFICVPLRLLRQISLVAVLAHQRHWHETSLVSRLSRKCNFAVATFVFAVLKNTILCHDTISVCCEVTRPERRALCVSSTIYPQRKPLNSV